MFFDVARRAIDDLQSRLVACLVIIAPRTHSVMTKQNALSLRVVLNQLLDLQPNFEAWPLPRDVDHLVTVNFLAELLLINGSSNRDDRVWVQMIYMLIRNKRMQGRVDRTSARIQIENAVAVHGIHRIL